MTLNRKVTGRASSIPVGLAISGVVSMLITILIVTIGASFISKDILPQEHIGYCSMLALLMGSALGAITAARKIKHRNILMCMMSGAVYYLMLLCLTALFFGGQYEGLGVTFLLVLGGSIVGTIISNREPGKGSGNRRKKMYR